MELQKQHVQNKKRKMKQQNNLHRLVLRIAQAHQFNTRSPQSYSNRVYHQINHLFPHHPTPDHPPYHLMIERAIKELNENGGSTMESISYFLETESNYNLPLPHLTLLKHHLHKLCQTGAIRFTQETSKYMLTASLNNPTPIRNRPTGIRGRQSKKQHVENGYDHQQHQQTGLPSAFKNIVNGEADVVNRLLPQKPDSINSFFNCDHKSVGHAAGPAMMVANENKCQKEPTTSLQQDTYPCESTLSDIWAPRR